jgi:hypothetical protein
VSQNDFVIANQSAPDFRSDLNNALQALASLSSGATAPATTYTNMLWYDTANKILKMRSEADDAWISIGYLDQTANAFRILDDTQVVNTSGTQTGLIGDQATATWETGTSTTESLVSPAKVKAAIEALAGVSTPVTEDPSGDASVVFLNLTGNFYVFAFDSIQPDSSSDRQLFMDVSSDNGSSWATSLALSSLANWQINGGGSGSVEFNTETITGFGALAYKSSGATKTGSIVTPRYSTATVAANAVRFRWNTGNFRTLTGQRIIKYER